MSNQNNSDKGLMENILKDSEVPRSLRFEKWYFGIIPRDKAENILINDGDFLVRKTDVNNKERFAVSVKICSGHDTKVHHYLINRAENELWELSGFKQKTIIILIEYLVKEKHALQLHGSRLIKAIPRPDHYILHEHIELGKKLGGGAFGNVHLGVWKKAHGKAVDVAIKKLKGIMHKKERCELVKEARIMRKFNHANLVQLIGVAPNEMPMMIILELCPGGSLLSHLKKNPDIKPDKLTAYCIDACRGMCYLSLRKVIHRDIAARNCLMGKNDSLKISDFGLAVANQDCIKVKELKSMPLRWLSPETLKKGEFSTKSDVWSFGVMIWEVFVHCKYDPFPGAKICSGHDPFDAPEGTPPLLQSVIKLCFTQDPNQRPDFEALFKILSPNKIPPKIER